MADQPLLSVRGEAVLEVEPEIARLALTVTARDADRAKTLRLLNERAGAIDALLSGFGGAIETVETSAVRVSPQLKSDKPKERVAGYVAVVQHTITVAGLDRLGELFAQLADQDMTDVAGPWWALRRDSPAYRRARVEAVQDAVRRARDYAQAFGSDLTALVEVADVGLLGQAEPVFAAAALPARAVRAQAAAPDEFTFDITPAKQTVRAGVEARFRISAPDLAGEPPGG